MKILCVFDNRLRADTTGNYFAWGFERLGHEVQHIWPEESLALQSMEWDLAVKIDDGIREHNQWNEKLRPCAYYCIDSHYFDAAEWRPDVAKQFDWSFTAQKNGVDFMREHGIHHCSWLPLAADENLHTPDINGYDKFDWAFVGNIGHASPQTPNKRLDYLDALLKRYPNGVISDYSFFKEMSNLYGQSRIVFNASINNDINMRFFEGLMSGAFVLTENVEENGQEELCEWKSAPLHGCFDTYQNEEELFQKMKHWLECDEDGRKIIAGTARQTALEGHKYSDRCQAIIERMNEL